MKIGIDIGGTNTHAVLVTDQGKLVMATNYITTLDILTGVHCAIQKLFERTGIGPDKVKGIFIGTTELLNAVFEERVMAKTALIRIGIQPTLIQPALNWPLSLKSSLREVYFLESSNRYNKPNQEIEFQKGLDPLFQLIASNSIEAVCIVGAYSPMYEEEELQVKNAIKYRFPNVPITTSHQLGSIGYVERENASLLNTLLSKLIKGILTDLANCFSSLSLKCPFWLTQSNGSLMTVQDAVEFPVLTIASGVANSLKGAAILSSLKDMIAVDVGGSKICVGRVSNGQIREVTSTTNLLGIEASLAMPDFISLPYGGGSIPSIKKDQVNFLPLILNNIEKDGMAWGGQTWTVTDSFLKLFPESFYDPNLDGKNLDNLSINDCKNVVYHVMTNLKSAIDQFQNQDDDLPIVLVGGASPLFNEQLFGKYIKVINPAGYSISSAIGACFAPISETVDKVYWLNNRSKDEILDEAVNTCKNALLKKGANPASIQIAYVEEYPFEYLKGEVLRIRIKGLGKLD